MAQSNDPILIVGAGPTGLVLALSLARRGVAVRIIDRKDGPGEHSRAMGLHARTLELYHQFGLADEIVRSGIVADTVHLRRRGIDAQNSDGLTLHLSELGERLSPYPYLLTYPQDDHERLLVGKLAALGVDVEWRTTLTALREVDGSMHATIARDGTDRPTQAAWVIGCDGAHSTVRQALGIGFDGGTYDQLFYVADVAIDGGLDREIYVNLGTHSLALMMPVRSSGMQRLIGLVPDALSDRTDLTFEDVRGHVEPLVGVTVSAVNWFSTYRVHHRVAAGFRKGRAFIAGDAGHVHSPAGGQGMNTGIGDAINLGWKLAAVVQGRAPAALLDSYEPERLPFARHLVATTDRAFDGMIADGFKGEAVRRWIIPAVVNTAMHFETTRRLAFRTVSQIAISYPDSALSEGEAGIAGGDRLAWVETADGQDNFALLQSLDWQAHVYGEAASKIGEACRALDLPLHVFPWTDAASAAGLKRDAYYLVRPDGYVALAARGDASDRLRAYADRHGIRFAARIDRHARVAD